MKCSYCQQETVKLIENCPLGQRICPKCCFHISAGAPEYITGLKKTAKLTKDEILGKCASCTPIK
jgi:hypothetical protein